MSAVQAFLGLLVATQALANVNANEKMCVGSKSQLHTHGSSMLQLRQSVRARALNNSDFKEVVFPATVDILDRAIVPDLVITGIGDSGTRGVKTMMEHLGVAMCPNTNEFEDNVWTMPTHDYIIDLLTSANGHVSDRKGQLSSSVFGEAVQAELYGALKTRECSIVHNNLMEDALPTNFKWGYKNPMHFYLLPVMDVAFGHKHKILLVARDPRDICTGDNMAQFESFGRHVSPRRDLQDFRAVMNKTMLVDERTALHTNKMIMSADGAISTAANASTLFESCMAFWANAWSSTLQEYAYSDRFLIVRIEDIVVPDPVTSGKSHKTLKRMMQFVNISSDGATMQAELENAHTFKNSYMGHHNELSDQDRATLEEMTASMAGLVHEVMQALGYNLTHYELVKPEYPHVIS